MLKLAALITFLWIFQKYTGYAHIALEVINAKSASKNIEELGIEITEKVEYEGAQFFFIRDPDNNVIEFHQLDKA